MQSLEEQHAQWFSGRFDAVLANVGEVIKGKRDQVTLALLAVFSEGHVLIEDVPGTGKTVLAKSIAVSFSGVWHRVQFTPDLLPADITGGLVYDQSKGTFDFHRGPVFANVVLGDEINRASPKTQSALLQVMEERHITVGSTTHAVPRPFTVIATQNSSEHEGTYRLPDAQIDRFLIRMKLDYPDHDHEVDVLRSVAEGGTAERLTSVISHEDASQMILIASAVHLNDDLRSYIVRLCWASRKLPELRLGVSTRGAIAVMRVARTLAAAQGRVFVTVDDVKAIAHSVMAHRMLLTGESELRHVCTDDLVERLLNQVPVPDAVRAAG